MLKNKPAYVKFEAYYKATGEPALNMTGSSMWMVQVTKDQTASTQYMPTVINVDTTNAPGWYSFILPASYTDCSHLFLTFTCNNSAVVAEPWESTVENYASDLEIPSVEEIQEGLAVQTAVEEVLTKLAAITQKQGQQADTTDLTAIVEAVSNVQQIANNIDQKTQNLPNQPASKQDVSVTLSLTPEQLNQIAEHIINYGDPSLVLFLNTVFNSVINNGLMEVGLPGGTSRRFVVSSSPNSQPIVSVRPIN